MVQVAWSTSNLKVYTARDGSATVCESCCDGLAESFRPGDGSYDCCCFLDPSTEAWDSQTTYNTGGLAEYNNATWKSLQDNNLNHSPSVGAWWTVVSGTTNCGNSDWDTTPPYGGPGKTPLYYRVTFFDVEECGTACKSWPGDLNTVFKLKSVYAGGRQCRWSRNPYDHDCSMPSEGDDYWRVTIDLQVTYPYGRFLSATHDSFEDTGNCCSAFLGEIPKCQTQGQVDNGYVFCDVENGAGGYATIEPWNVGPWEVNHEYFAGDDVEHHGGIYHCILGHTSSHANEPGEGISWETYWNIGFL